MSMESLRHGMAGDPAPAGEPPRGTNPYVCMEVLRKSQASTFLRGEGVFRSVRLTWNLGRRALGKRGFFLSFLLSALSLLGCDWTIVPRSTGEPTVAAGVFRASQCTGAVAPTEGVWLSLVASESKRKFKETPEKNLHWVLHI